ncbi:uncharacterized protein LOC131879429 isoform X2 [Tigriopus californicus]|uniref:uncharacterized protein LOC131879429 isoform X2 n=1 Tax=Tigriopus californicus TaxID=6832 RepID=UPI0027DA0EE9|nr:uncharacterized protein LOC131879429 isoform X2 [Tigriopus californicus]XP_059081736.1 uncharacterized protein LOC131879429 isoform X2 [Tigriopus californicus]
MRIKGLPDLQTLSYINLFTSFLLLAIIWLVLTPILDGTVTIVRSDNINTDHYESNSLLTDDRSAYMTNFDSEEQSLAIGQDYVYDDGSQYAPTYYSEAETDGQYRYQNDWNFASRVFPNIWTRMSRKLDGIDVLDSTFGLMKIDSETCRAKSVCEMEAKAAQSPFFAVIMRSANKYLSGLERYGEARYFGQTGQDCSLIYSECSSSLRPY